jgi:hypothetical protein
VRLGADWGILLAARLCVWFDFTGPAFPGSMGVKQGASKKKDDEDDE